RLGDGGRSQVSDVSRLNYKVEGRRESEVSGQRSGLKANARFWRWRRQRGRINYVHHALQNRHDDRFMNVESLFQFLFSRGEFLSQLAFVTEQCSHFQKGSDDKDCHLDRTWAVQHIRSHDGTVLSENIGTAAAASVAQT